MLDWGFLFEDQREGQCAWLWRGGRKEKGVRQVCSTPLYRVIVKEFELDAKSNGKHRKVLNRTEK